MKIGIIGGSGLYEIDGFEFIEDISVETEYGKPSDSYKHFKVDDIDFYFLNRHGKKHTLPPHKVNYRANLYGFKQLGVERIISFTAVGGINRLLKPGDIVVSDNAIDFTSSRENTFYSGPEVHHIDITFPFCPELRKILINSLSEVTERFFDRGVYICTNGPRLETAAEINMFRMWGADIVGMTLFPEVSLSRELEICYANVAVVTNFAAGISDEKLTVDEVVDVMANSTEKIKKLLSNSLVYLSSLEHRRCFCATALNKTRISK